ncbi:hypothetical protein KAFR_0L00320 [Kazachstania africana CBS 2517]|uniref:Histone-binding protein RBBP4-like N-terminal domain-containing protein n=1 Tax=Kazachstania africana (strain ATCC 22294 / BCRC 22015 / CBS 2517 / CECT 1963 / NBRC 1671 / NRRL Y-8276) TaxID=1071382 RepID=H2B1Y9_KAZAF|nr:hypothetical protein KAFR_0L00320 [Kazachstania africana CBS 2517]CCF60639.1 hypothetical protein KAFR_0L00320 [Kazachstania africana CBS 2517]
MGPQEEERELSIDEEYKLWKSNVPLMYDFVSETKLTWPSLTVEWLPHDPQAPLTQQEMIIGTHTSDQEPNYVKIASIELPNEVIDPHNVSDAPVKSNVRITKKFKLEKEITRSRYMVQDPNIISTIDGNGTVSIFDRNSSDSPVKTYSYHKDNGYGLSFNPISKGQLLSAADDGYIAMYDINAESEDPVETWQSTDNCIINDIKWHHFDATLFGTVSEEKNTLSIYDLRTKDKVTSIEMEQPFNSLAFSKHSKNLFSAAGTDQNVYLYDLRNTRKTLHSMSGHEGPVTNLEFHDSVDGILVSSSEDRRIIIWDLMEIGSEQVNEDAQDATPELMMIHAGHRSSVNDFSLNSSIPWLIASTEEENIIQVWKSSSRLPRISNSKPFINYDLIN